MSSNSDVEARQGLIRDEEPWCRQQGGGEHLSLGLTT
jgi:hypothetical protein